MGDPEGPSHVTQDERRNIKKISIVFSMRSIVILLWFHFSQRCAKVLYGQNGERTMVVARKTPVIEVPRDFLLVACEDLKDILANLSSSLQTFSIKFRETSREFNTCFFSLLDESLSILTPKLQVVNVKIQGASEPNFFSILRNFDPSPLSTIKISTEDTKNFKAVLDLEEKNLKKMACQNVFVEIGGFFNKVKDTHDFDQVKETIVRTIETPHGALKITTIGTNYERKMKFEQEIAPAVRDEYSPGYKALVQRVVLENIVSHLDGIDIAKLRKLSVATRNCLDLIRPNSKITQLSIEAKDAQKLQVIYNTKSVVYQKLQDNKCKCNKQIVDGDYRTILINDLEINLRNQKTEINNVKLDFPNDLEFFQMLRDKVLFGRAFLWLKIRNLAMSVFNEQEIMAVLPNIDSNSLKVLALKGKQTGRVERTIDLNDVVKLEQWKSVEELILNSFVITTPLQQLKLDNKTIVDIFVMSVSSNDLIYLKNLFLSSPRYIRFQIQYTSLDSNNDNGWGMYPDAWYFAFPNSEQVLFVMHNNSAFVLKRVEVTDVPIGVEVRP